MLWDTTAHAGFTAPTATPWLPVSPDYAEINAQAQWQDSTSLLRFYADILKLRNASDVLRFGSLQIAENRCDIDVLAYYRTLGKETFLILLNFSNREKPIIAPEAELLLSTAAHPEKRTLRPLEGRVLRLQ